MRRKMGCKTAVSVLAIAASLFGASAAMAATLEYRLQDGDTPAPGATVTLEAVLVTSQGDSVVGTENVITYTDDGVIPPLAPADCPGDLCVPNCTVNPDIKKDLSAFAYLPTGCDPASDCTEAKAIVAPLPQPAQQGPIASGSVLYTCEVSIADSVVVGTSIPLGCIDALASNPAGVALDGESKACTGSDGARDGDECDTADDCPDAEDTCEVAGEMFCPGVEILIPGGPTPTPTSTDTPTATVTPTPTDTQPPPAGGEDDDGCQVVAPASSKSGWLVLLPVGVLLWVRRRSR